MRSGSRVIGFAFLISILLFYPSSPLEKVVRAYIESYFLDLDKNFLNCFPNSGAPDCLIILSFFHHLFAFYALGEILSEETLLALYIVGLVKYWLC